MFVHVQGQPVDAYPTPSPHAERGTLLRITEIGEEVLNRPCREVTEFGTPELAKLIDDMFHTMHIAEGAGLAANQVGVDLRLFVFDCLDGQGGRHVGHILNPVLEQPPTSERRLLDAPEGCLSVPGARMTVPRTDHATVHGVDQNGHPLTIEGTDYFARCLHHETDHLLGSTYLDRLSKRDRKEALRQMEERREQVYAERKRREAKMRTAVSS